eukprot:GHVO01047948.1.p1 GENE.GHVO01047948.1~~GHVO01047948.1.p1  ORF type:complete len:139 (-),score=20.62 GHVO01047948.1:111-503(-)
MDTTIVDYAPQAEKSKLDYGAIQEDIFRVRLTLTSTNLADIEELSKEYIGVAKKKGLQVRGPLRMPKKNLVITTRKSPCGEGTNTWDRFEMRIYKRVIYVECTASMISDLVSNDQKATVSVDVHLTTIAA